MNLMTRRLCLALCSLHVLFGFNARSEPSTEPPADADPAVVPELLHWDYVDEWTRSKEASHSDDSDSWVAQGIVAKRADSSIELLAEATGLSEENPIEFWLISDSSGHDYEALAIAYARPTDIHNALQFIGLQPGAPVNPRALRFFPKGERVLATFSWTDEEGTNHRWRAESLLMDARTGKALAPDGFAFVGSQWVDTGNERVYAAEQFDPQSIISVYNERTTILDRPYVVPQGEVYGRVHPYPGRQPAYGRLVHVRLVPEFTNAHRRLLDVTLDIQAGDAEQPIELSLKDESGAALHDGSTLAHILAELNRIIENEQTAFIQPRIGPDVPLHELRDLFRLLRSFEEEKTLHIEPPATGHLFYRAFLPNESHRDRAHRPSQVLELHLTRQSEDGKNEGLAGTLIDVRDIRAQREDPFEAELTEYPVASPQELPEALSTIQHRLPVLLVFASADTTYEMLMQWVTPAMNQIDTIYVFLGAPGPASNPTSE